MNKEFYIAGVKFHNLATAINKIKEGDKLLIVPEPTNKFDPNAIKLLFEDEKANVMLGYIPKIFSSEISASLDLELDLECIIIELNSAEKPWKQCKVVVRESNDVEEERPDESDSLIEMKNIENKN